MSASPLLLGSLLFFLSTVSALPSLQPPPPPPAPPIPTWPDLFNIKFVVYVEEYGPDWKHIGHMYYNWNKKSFRVDFLDWCIPLFDSGPGEYNNYTCSFVATKGNMYFINHTASTWQDNECCLFEKGLAAVPPDWMKNTHYNGTEKINGVVSDRWWHDGTNDPLNPCVVYWDTRNGSVPVQFFGLSSLGPTILSYYDFQKDMIPIGIDPEQLPIADCDAECEEPLMKMKMKKSSTGQNPLMWWPNWPSCE